MTSIREGSHIPPRLLLLLVLAWGTGGFVHTSPVAGQSTPAAAQAARTASTPAPATSREVAAVDSIFRQWDRSDSPGAAVAVVRDGEVILEKGYGMANLEYDIPVTPSTVFHVASVSKHFTAFAVGLLAAEGKLSLDDDVRDFVPELHDYGHTITLRHLIHHVSGIRDQWDLLGMAGWRLDDVITTEQILKLVSAQRELNFEPGDEHLYSNSGYTLLALVVERVTGETFRDFMGRRVFDPLGMDRTHVHDDHRMIVPNRAYSYGPAGEDQWRIEPLQYANMGATSLFTTVEDLARWDRNLYDARVGGREVVDGLLDLIQLNDGSDLAYAHALSTGTHRGLRTVSHGGSDAGFRSFLLRFPDEGLTVVALSNARNFNSSRTAHEVAEVFLAQAFTDPPPEAGSAASNSPGGGGAGTEDEPFSPSAEVLRSYEGTYWSDELSTLYRVEATEEGLVLTHSRHSDLAILPDAEDGFSGTRWPFSYVRFTRDSDGSVSGLLMSGGRARDIRFVRQPGSL